MFLLTDSNISRCPRPFPGPSNDPSRIFQLHFKEDHPVLQCDLQGRLHPPYEAVTLEPFFLLEPILEADWMEDFGPDPKQAEASTGTQFLESGRVMMMAF